jgi:hypothetical protein
MDSPRSHRGQQPIDGIIENGTLCAQLNEKDSHKRGHAKYNEGTAKRQLVAPEIFNAVALATAFHHVGIALIAREPFVPDSALQLSLHKRREDSYWQ